MKKNILIILITAVVVSVLWQLILVQKINAERKHNPSDYSDCEQLNLRHNRLLEERIEQLDALKLYKQLLKESIAKKNQLAEFLLDKEKAASYLFDLLIDEDEYNSASIIYYIALEFNPNHWGNNAIVHTSNSFVESSEHSEPRSMLAYLISKAPRDADFIRRTFTQPLIEGLAKKFAATKSYRQGGERLVNALLMAYDEVHNQPQLLEEIYNRALESNTIQDTNYYNIASDRVAKVLLEDHEINDRGQYDDLVSPLSKYALVYGFWARRYHEGNMTEVHDILMWFSSAAKKYAALD